MAKVEALMKAMKDKWPSAIVARGRVSEFTGGLIEGHTLANLDAQGTGPKERVLMGRRKVAYPVDALCAWLNERMEMKEV